MRYLKRVECRVDQTVDFEQSLVTERFQEWGKAWEKCIFEIWHITKVPSSIPSHSWIKLKVFSSGNILWNILGISYIIWVIYGMEILTRRYDEIEQFIFRYFDEKILISDKILADRPENFNFQKWKGLYWFNEILMWTSCRKFFIIFMPNFFHHANFFQMSNFDKIATQVQKCDSQKCDTFGHVTIRNSIIPFYFEISWEFKQNCAVCVTFLRLPNISIISNAIIFYYTFDKHSQKILFPIRNWSFWTKNKFVQKCESRRSFRRRS